MTTSTDQSRSESWATQVEGTIQIVIMIAIGVAAGAASFTHVHNVAATHGQGGWLAWADAVVLELMSIASGMELRRRKRQHKSVRFPSAVMCCAVALSISAQVVAAEFSVIGWLAAALPALGFLVMVKIAIGRAAPTAGQSRLEARPGMAVTRDDAIEGADAPASSARIGGITHWSVAAPDTSDTATSSDDEPRGRQNESEPETSAKLHPPDPADFEDVADLLPAATAARRALLAQGQALTHKTLAGRLRADGYSLSNARAATLLKILKNVGDGQERRTSGFPIAAMPTDPNT